MKRTTPIGKNKSEETNDRKRNERKHLETRRAREDASEEGKLFKTKEYVSGIQFKS